MRVLLARPNSPMQAVAVPLGLGYLSHALLTRRNDQTKILDGRAAHLPPQAMVAKAREFDPHVIGVTAMTFEAPEAINLISRFKEAFPDTPLLLGGPHATGYGPDLLAGISADYLVLGEGENTLVEFLEALEGKREMSEVLGLVRREGQDVIFNGPRPLIDDMSILGIDWDGMRTSEYFTRWRRNAGNTIARSHRRLSMFFSRGCPIGCIFCHQIFGRKYREFSIEKTVEEMVRLRDRYRLEEFEIIDDTLNLKLDRAKAVLQEIIRQKLGAHLAFTAGLRADRVDEELLDLAVKAGVYRIDYAIESASPRVQKLINKNLDLERAREVVNMTVKKGLVTGAYYMLGFPGETREEMESTLEYALELDNHIASFFYMMPFPGTAVAEADPQTSQKARQTTFRDASGIAINLSAVSDEEMSDIRRAGYRRFYFSGRRILRIGRDVPMNARMLASVVDVVRLSFKDAVDY